MEPWRQPLAEPLPRDLHPEIAITPEQRPADSPRGTADPLPPWLDALSRSVEALRFAPPVHAVYNPLGYARAPLARYLERFGQGSKECLFLGMNPGPWGMAQTGVPFGEIEAVRGWMAIDAPVGKPRDEHPKRPVLGFDCPRSEVSGRRLWGWAAERFGTPEAFFRRFMVWNYCPLLFLEESGRNRVPEKLPAEERAPLYAACDRAFLEAVDAFDAPRVVGVGQFAETRARAVLEAAGRTDIQVGRVLHPSPASPAANRGWAEQAERELKDQGIALP